MNCSNLIPLHMKESKYVAPNILKKIQKSKFSRCANFIVGNSQIYIQHPNLDDKLLEIIKLPLQHLKKYLPKTLNIYCYPVKTNKKFVGNYDRKHINSGYCTYYRSGLWAEIVIFRHEDWFRTLIHELFHGCLLDRAEEHKDINLLAIQKKFPINCNFLVFETYCESWARILNSKFYAKIYGKSCKKILQQEIQFTIKQAKNALANTGLKFKDILKPNSNYTENSNMFCYYILTALVLSENQEFTELFEYPLNSLQEFTDYLATRDTDRFIRRINSARISATNSARMVKFAIAEDY